MDDVVMFGRALMCNEHIEWIIADRSAQRSHRLRERGCGVGPRDEPQMKDLTELWALRDEQSSQIAIAFDVACSLEAVRRERIASSR
jgi:hypothetical protein